VGTRRRAQPQFRVADEPDGPPELRAISFRPLADEGERLGADREPTPASVSVAPEPSRADGPLVTSPAIDANSAPTRAPDMDAGEDPAALAFTFAPKAGGPTPAPSGPRLNAARGREAALLVAVAAAAFALGRGTPSAVREHAAPAASPAGHPDRAHRERPRRGRRPHSRATRNKPPGAGRRRDARRPVSRRPTPAARTGVAPRTTRAMATASTALATPRRGATPPDEFGFEGHQ
jgi:hypothetical protein